MKANKETMTKIDEVRKNADSQIISLLSDEAKKTNPYKIGDILQDHYQIGKVISITYGISSYSYTYDIIFECKNLRKDLVQKKYDKYTSIYLQNVKRKIK